MIHIIHSDHRSDRLATLMYELDRQGIADYRLWPAIFDKPVCKGVSRAHKQIVAYAKEQGLPEVVIMEDDVKFPADDGYWYYLQHKPKQFDLYLGGIYRGEIVDGRVKDFSSLHLYTIRQQFYDTFLSVDESKHIDTALGGLGDYRVCYPFAAIQYDGFSNNNDAMSNHAGLIKDREVYGL